MTNEHRPYADEGELTASLNAIRSQMDRIEAQTSKTNGRVTRLEAWRYAVMAVVGLLVLEVGWLIAAGVIK